MESDTQPTPPRGPRPTPSSRNAGYDKSPAALSHGELDPWIYDAVMWPAERLFVRRWRRRLYGAVSAAARAGDAGAGAGGARVLEIGAGTGAGFGYFAPGTQVAAVEPSPVMAARARIRAASVWGARGSGVRSGASGPAPVVVTVVGARAEKLPFGDGSFDSAVATLTWCSVADPVAAFAEVRRVLRPGGRLFLLEHVHNTWQPARKLQSMAAPTWRRVAWGCRIDQDTVGLLEAAGFAVERRRDHLFGWIVELEASVGPPGGRSG